jgi:Protein of unknown function (DUF1553)/Protein of unknown function (DUF1549)
MPANMPKLVHYLVLSVLALAGTTGVSAGVPELVVPYEAEGFTTVPGKIDELVLNSLARANVRPARPCSDEVFVRRVYLDVLGLPPTAAEAEAFLKDTRTNKRAVLINQLLIRPEHVDYWTMRWCDLLRVKSEFPINLWPNAVQAYQRWIHQSLLENMPYDRMARELLTASGSNFRVPQVNFLRAIQGRGKQPLAAAVALTFMGTRLTTWPDDRRAGLESLFSRVAYKATAEWKEEIVCLDPSATEPLEAVLPDGRAVVVPAGSDPRMVFADWLITAENRWFARAAVNRTWAWIFGRGIVHEPDDLRPGNLPSVPGLLEYLEREFVASGYDQRALLRLILNSRVYHFSSIPRSQDPRATGMFASYPVRRLEAEVLQDAVCALTGTTEGYQSPIPEPFTYIPAGPRSVNLADGSITSPFLELFGRSSRESGLVMERISRISAAQRLYLLNSSQMQGKIERSWRLKNLMEEHRKDPGGLVRALWLAVLSREPTADELGLAIRHLQATDNGRKEGANDLVWALANSKEFLYRH